MKQIVWAKAAALGTPNDQRVEIIRADGPNNIHVMRLGSNSATTINALDIIAFEVPIHESTESIIVRLRTTNKPPTPLGKQRK